VGRVRGVADRGALVGGIDDLLRAAFGADERTVYAGSRGDRVVHNAHRIKLQGESLRKTKEKQQGLTKTTKSKK
jgi:hypothetical protein